MNTKELEDRTSLKELVDSVSILADRKDVHTRCSYFLKMQCQKLLPEVQQF